MTEPEPVAEEEEEMPGSSDDHTLVVEPATSQPDSGRASSVATEPPRSDDIKEHVVDGEIALSSIKQASL